MFCIITLNANSQNMKAISEHATWCTSYQMGMPPTDYYYIYKSSGDTIINDTNYIKLYSALGHRNGFDSYNQDSPFVYHSAFRNDTNDRAYIFPANDSIEHLWYDFNLSVGDTLPENPTWYSTQGLYPGDNITVISIDSIMYCNTYYKKYVFDVNHHFPDLVYGVGFNGDLININGIYFEYAVGLDFFCSDTLISNCCFTITGIQNFDNDIPDILISPNPVIDILSVAAPAKSIIEIFNINGQIIKKEFIDNRSATIDMTDLLSGVYIVRVTTANEIVTNKFIKE